MAVRYHDAVTDPVRRCDLRIDGQVLGAALLRRSAGMDDEADRATIQQAIEILQNCLPEGEPLHVGTRPRGCG